MKTTTTGKLTREKLFSATLVQKLRQPVPLYSFFIPTITVYLIKQRWH